MTEQIQRVSRFSMMPAKRWNKDTSYRKKPMDGPSQVPNIARPSIASCVLKVAVCVRERERDGIVSNQIETIPCGPAPQRPQDATCGVTNGVHTVHSPVSASSEKSPLGSKMRRHVRASRNVCHTPFTNPITCIRRLVLPSRFCQ